MNNLLLVIDLQNCFINQYTENLPGKIQKLIDEQKFDKVLFTRFINTPNSVYCTKAKWYGCLTEEEISLAINPNYSKVIDKETYTSFNNNLENYIRENNINQIYLCGVDTECCVLKTAFDLFENGYDVYVLKDYCGCMVGQKEQKNALDIIERCIGSEYVI